MSTVWFTSDEHYGHRNIIKYCNRPFEDVNDMDSILIFNHNCNVNNEDWVIHGGDFSMIRNKETVYRKYISYLKGKHVFLRGSHDYWMRDGTRYGEIWERRFGEYYIVVCHYAMRVWPRSHYGSFMLYGHSHGNLPPVGKQHDIGVDNNNYRPISLDEVIEIMKTRDDNPNYLSLSNSNSQLLNSQGEN